MATIPSDVNVALDPTAGTVDYLANGGISSLDATLSSTAPFFDRVTKVVVRAEEIPNELSLAYKRPTRRAASGWRRRSRSVTPRCS